MEFLEFITPELLVLVPVLYIVGAFIKHSERCANKYIPITLGLIGVVLAVLYVLATSTLTSTQDWMLAAFTAIIQGILCAGTAVYTNQLIKQSKEGK
jgi:uncharacterized membrane protein HdeD (DUF308 family)